MVPIPKNVPNLTAYTTPGCLDKLTAIGTKEPRAETPSRIKMEPMCRPDGGGFEGRWKWLDNRYVDFRHRMNQIR